ncbi:MAG: M15 family metallopeptidase [Tyzzerella sp.]|nr:M15 family metallopeptidase [Tyzzerella sp.]
MEAETVLDETRLNQELIDNLFYSVQISEEIKDRIWNVSYKENDNISLEELRYLRVLYRGFDGETHIGELIVNQSIAEDILEIMFELYRNDYPIEKMVLVDEYNGDDEASMEDNNTSAFNYRVIAGSNNLSKHGFGLAIDINPKYNPYVVERADGEIVVSPENGVDYVERSKDFSYKLSEDDLCVRLFLEHGFTWGGNWNSLKDYQHFEK